MEHSIVEKLNLIPYIGASDSCLAAMEFAEHNLAHVSRVAKMACKILSELGYSEHTIELTEIAGYMHDIGNVVNRHDHAHSSAILAYDILLKNGYELEDILKIISAIGNHDVTTGFPVSPIAAALIIADKSDVRRSRVRKQDINTFDIYDKVHYSVDSSILTVDKGSRVITLRLKLNTNYSSVLDYYDTFYSRMQLCKKAAEYLDMKFCLQINDVKLMD